MSTFAGIKFKLCDTKNKDMDASFVYADRGIF